jgi:hypothetical protein
MGDLDHTFEWLEKAYAERLPRLRWRTARSTNFAPRCSFIFHPDLPVPIVVGDVPYVSLHFLGADHYANK